MDANIAAIAAYGTTQIAYCAMTFTDALAWTAARLEQEVRGLCEFMTANWPTLSYESQETLIREKRALRMATLARMGK